MQIDETVHGCPVAVVHLIVRLEIPALQVKSGPLPGSRLWLRPVGCAMELKNGDITLIAHHAIKLLSFHGVDEAEGNVVR